MTDWWQLQHAYGSADDLPALLESLSPDAAAPVWDEVWSRICHQGSVYTASWKALPVLLEHASRWSPRERIMPLFLSACIVASEDVVGQDGRSEAQPAIESLHRLAQETLSSGSFERLDLIDLLAATQALGGQHAWGRALPNLSQGELSGICPACATDLLVAIGEFGFFVAIEEWVNRPDTPRVPIMPADPSGLPRVGAWLYQQAIDGRDPELATWITHVFGTSMCLACQKEIEIAQVIIGAA